MSSSEFKLIVDREQFLSQFPWRSFQVKHPFAGHPLFELPRLVELYKFLPTTNVEYNAGSLAINQDPNLTPRSGLSVEETIRGIEECNSWLVLKYVEQHPEYQKLLEGVLAEVRAWAGPIVGETDQLEGFIFVSSPNAVTPYHMDPEHNFLLQVRGEKTVYMFDGADRELVSELDLERFYEGRSHRNLPYREEFQQKATTYVLQPGDGLHFPVADPHWVKVGNNVSISFSVTFRSDVSARITRLYKTNAALRRWGLAPTPPGSSKVADEMKDFAFRIVRKSRKLLGASDMTAPRY